MNEYKYHYLFTSFDLETYDLEDFKYNFVNITSFRLVDTADVGVKQILKDIGLYSHHIFKKPYLNLHFTKSTVLESEPALMFDSVYVFAIGLQTLEQSHSLTLSNISCEEENSWDGGLSLINYLNAVSSTTKQEITFY
ncbi:glutamate receptor ionotropic, kainate 1 [Drosophila sechellia]|nr:glutamate receptor ionotropic, kainate 1 [Drosophila sechellia]